MPSLDGSPAAGIRRRDAFDALLGRIEGGDGATLADAEILAALLGPRRYEGRLERAHRLLEVAGLHELGRRTGPLPRGLSALERLRVAAAFELGRRLHPGDASGQPIVRGPRDVYEATADLRTLRREHFVGLYLNTRNRLLARETISVGSLNASIVHPREVFEPALRQGAASLVVVHNHPSGETDPSEDDLAITRRLTEAGEILGIPLVDHVIVGTFGFTSLKETEHF